MRRENKAPARAVTESEARFQLAHPNIPKAQTETHASQDGKSLEFYKRIANKVISIKSCRIDADKATLEVNIHTDTIVNHERYNYGTAQVGMVGEGNYWRFNSFTENNLVYKKAPQ